VILVDTSVWIEVFKKHKPLDLEALISFDDIATCLPVIQEVLQGFRDERPFAIAKESMFNLPVVESPLERSVFEEAVELYRAARRRGFTVRSSVDCVVAACALRHDLIVFHRDRDYGAIAKVSALQERRV